MKVALKPDDLQRSTVVAVKDQISSHLADEAVILHLKSGIYFGLNEVGARIWSIIQQPTPLSELQSRLLAEYEVKPEVFVRDLLNLLEDLQAAELIEVYCE